MSKTIPAERTVINRGDSYLKASSNYFDSEPGQILSKWVNEKTSRLDDKLLSSRIINHWEKSGLIPDSRPSGKGWRKYSILDLVWIQILAELRKFGFPIDKIFRVKNNLDEYDFEFLVVVAIVYRRPVTLLVFQNCDTELVTQNEYRATQEPYNLSNHIVININDILQKIFPKKDMSPQFEKDLEVSSEELDLLFMIRMGNYESITIKTNEGKIERLEASKTENKNSRIMDLIQSGNYQTIEIKQHRGKITHIRRIVKKSYKKNGTNP